MFGLLWTAAVIIGRGALALEAKEVVPSFWTTWMAGPLVMAGRRRELGFQVGRR